MDGDAGWVLQADAPTRIERAARRLEQVGVERWVVLRDGALCAELTDPPTDRLRDRVGSALGHPVEERLNCDVAAYPLGRGSVVWILDPPAEGLEALLDATHPVYREVVRPLTPEEPVRLCIPALAVAEPADLAAALHEAGYRVRGTYEVGGCRR